MVLLHTTGAKSGKERVNPLVYQRDGERIVVFGSKAGAPTHPDWFHNVRANPEVTAEVGTDTRRFRARITEGDERERIWAKQKEEFPGFAEYEEKTDRQIPVIVLEPVDS